MRILIADDHAIFREGVKQVLARCAHQVVTDEVADGRDLLGKIRDTEYDAVILDISLPGRSGLDALAAIKALRPKLPVLILSMHPEEQYALRALKLGASGYLTKGSSSRELLTALDKVTLGKKYVSATLAETLANQLGAKNDGPLHDSLSDREFQVMRRIATGAAPRAIAEEMHLSIKTVNTYRGRILQKMNMKCNAELTRYAVEHELI